MNRDWDAVVNGGRDRRKKSKRSGEFVQGNAAGNLIVSGGQGDKHKRTISGVALSLTGKESPRGQAPQPPAVS